jgi:hypothetical protein
MVILMLQCFNLRHECLVDGGYLFNAVNSHSSLFRLCNRKASFATEGWSSGDRWQ